MGDLRGACLALTSVVAFWTGCTSEGGAVETDASADRFVSATPLEAGPLPERTAQSCSGRSCDPVKDSPLGVSACCNPEGLCGVKARAIAGDGCLSPNGAGHVDLTCPGLKLAGGPALQGCCSPEGECGIFDRFGDLACIARAEGAREAAECKYDPDAPSCRQLVEIVCDGAEDCAAGQTCCARRQVDSYDRTGCFDNCETVNDGDGSVWLELCNGEQPCENPDYECRTPPTLAPFLGRCYIGDDPAFLEPASDGVRCGPTSCNVGQKCCLRPPGDPYCSPVDLPCKCNDRSASPDGGRRDASADAQ